MKIASFIDRDNRRDWGVVRDDGIVRGSTLHGKVGGAVIGSIVDVIARGTGFLGEIAASSEEAEPDVALDAVRLLPPVVPSRDVFAIGVNYAAHFREAHPGGDTPLPSTPVVFSKALTSVTGPYDDIAWYPSLTQKLDYEVELAVVIGQGGRHIDPGRALDHVAGYMVANDVSARDVQHGRPEGQWFLGKSMDTFCPIGPWLVTADEIDAASGVDLSLRVNGETRQSSNTADLIFGVAELVTELSRFVTLLPGDIILTGTPSGVGAAMDPPRFLVDGDVVEAEVAGIGAIRNTVRAMA